MYSGRCDRTSRPFLFCRNFWKANSESDQLVSARPGSKNQITAGGIPSAGVGGSVTPGYTMFPKNRVKSQYCVR